MATHLAGKFSAEVEVEEVEEVEMEEEEEEEMGTLVIHHRMVEPASWEHSLTLQILQSVLLPTTAGTTKMLSPAPNLSIRFDEEYDARMMDVVICCGAYCGVGHIK